MDNKSTFFEHKLKQQLLKYFFKWSNLFALFFWDNVNSFVDNTSQLKLLTLEYGYSIMEAYKLFVTF